MDDLNRMGLSQAMDAPNALLQARRIPGRLEVDYGGSHLQVESDAARIGGEGDSAAGVAVKLLDEFTPVVGGDASRKRNKSDPPFAQSPPRQERHAFIFAENHHFAVLLQREFADDLAEL